MDFLVFYFHVRCVRDCSYRETYDAKILQDKARVQRRSNGNRLIYSRSNDHNLSAPMVIKKALFRPLGIFGIPIFLFLATSTCILNGYVYLVVKTITEVFQTTYGFSEGAAGLSFLGVALGMVTEALFCSLILDRYSKHQKSRHDGELKPE